jgi:hypothetical protein
MTTTSPHPLPAQTHLLNLILFLRRDHRGSYTQRPQSYFLKCPFAQRTPLCVLCVKKQNADNTDGADEHR